jgi:hypothetical protein
MFFHFQRQHLSRHEKYPHIVNVKTTENASPQHEISEVKAYDCKTIDMEGLPLLLLLTVWLNQYALKLMRPC